MTDIIEYIDSKLSLCYLDTKFWGLAEIVTKSKDRFPVTVSPGQNDSREKVCIDEDYNCVVWHREISSITSDSEEFNFGLTIEKQFDVTIRTVVAYKVDLGEQFKFEFINNLPQNIDLSGYNYLEVFPRSMNIDHEAIAKEEEIHTQYEKHRVCWNIFSFENEFRFILCPDSSPQCNNL